MSSREFTGPVHLQDGVRAGAVARDLVKVSSLSTVWLGLCWGLCVPLVVDLRPDGLLQAWVVTVPVCLAIFLLASRSLIRRLRGAGLPRDEASRRAAFVLSPAWIVGFSPAVLFVPARSLPVFLLAIAAVLIGYRWITELRPGMRKREVQFLEMAIFVAVFLAATLVLFQVHVVHDAFQYYGYLASVALDGDLNLYDQIYLHNAEGFYNPFPAQTARYIGTAVLQAPFFALGHAVAVTLHALGHPVPPNGYGLPYGFFITLASSLFGLAGLVLTYRLASGLFLRRTAMISTLAIGFASPLAFFMYVWGGWAHPIAFFLVAAFLLLWQRTREERSLSQWALLGLLVGLLALVRPTAVLVVLLPLLEWFAALTRRGRGEGSGSLLAGPGIAAAVAATTFSPQLSIWKALSGSWIAAPYLEVGDFHDWLHPDFSGLLFSTAQHGLLAWTPLLLVAGLGIGALVRKDRLLAAGSGLILLGTLYIYACWSIWWSGIGFSNRFFVELTPLFVLGLGALLQPLAKRNRRSRKSFPLREYALGLLALAVVWNLFLVGAYRANDIPQGIPDPYRVVDEPLTISRLATTALQVTPRGASPRWLDWGQDGHFTERILRAAGYRDPAAFVTVIASLLLAGLLALVTARCLLRAGGRRSGRAPTAWLLGSGLAAVIILHGTIWGTAAETRPIGRFHHLPETGMVIRQPSEDTWIYTDYNQPVTSVDLLSHLIYGHAVPQDAVVASVSIFDASGRRFDHLLRAGVDTAEASYPRPEYRDAIRHGIDMTEVVRARPAGVYSKRNWESLTFHTVMELPEPMVVRKIRLRYLHPAGRLVVTDLFLREF
jgi:hypothetical protein